MQIPKNILGQNFLLAKGHGCGETKAYQGPTLLNAGTATPIQMMSANWAYHAAALYMDTQMGIILEALESSSSKYDTIVVFLGDHGFHLGDKGLYCKHTNYEQGTKVPFIIRPPLRDSALYPLGKRSYAPVELLDLIPTLADMTQLNFNMSGYQPFQGTTLVPILNDPENAHVKQAAQSQYFRGVGSKRIWGYTVRTTRYRYTQWGKVFEELYDYLTDEWEMISLQKNKTLKNLMLNQAFHGGEFNLGLGKVPFDFNQRTNMANRAPQNYS